MGQTWIIFSYFASTQQAATKVYIVLILVFIHFGINALKSFLMSPGHKSSNI